MRLLRTTRWWSVRGDAMRQLGVVVWLGVLALLVLRLLASLNEVDSGITAGVGPDGSYVANVRVGSVAWFMGAEPGATYVAWPDGGGGQVITAERELGLDDAMPPRGWWAVGVAVVALVVSRGLRRWLPTLTSALLVGVTSFLAWELLGVAFMPLALLVVVVPTLVIGIGWLMGASGGRHRVVIAAATVAAITLEVGALATATRGTWRGIWAVASLTPAILAVGVAALTWVIVVRRAMATQGAGNESVAAAMVENTSAGRTALWSASERWRDDRAHWIHDAVLPQLATGIHDIESGHDAAGAASLHHLAEGLREGLEEDQLTVLRVGGLPAALENALAAARDEGFTCNLTVDAEGDAPPWPVLVGAWRVAQEAIGNARRHSGADRISVAATVRPDHLLLAVSDDGVGVTDEDLSRRRGHIGLQSMTDATQAVQASLEFMTRSPTGLSVRFEWGR